MLNLIGSDISQHTSYFSSLDIKSRKCDFIIADPANDYINSCFDVHGDTVISLVSHRPDKVHLTDVHTGKNAEVNISFDKTCCNEPFVIDVIHDQVFCTTDIYGFTLIDKQKQTGRIFHEYLLGDYNSTISYPVDTRINLLSGKRIGSNDGAIDYLQ